MLSGLRSEVKGVLSYQWGGIFSSFKSCFLLFAGSCRGELCKIFLSSQFAACLVALQFSNEPLLFHRSKPWTFHYLRPASESCLASPAEILILHPLFSQVTCAFLSAPVPFCFLFYQLWISIAQHLGGCLFSSVSWRDIELLSSLFFFTQILSVNPRLVAKSV